MPQENDMHIRAEHVVDETIPPKEPTYIEDIENKYIDNKWKLDKTLDKMIYVHIRPRNTLKISVYKVWYKDCIEEKHGVFT
jgi:hypothetical protein